MLTFINLGKIIFLFKTFFKTFQLTIYSTNMCSHAVYILDSCLCSNIYLRHEYGNRLAVYLSN